MNIRKSLFFVIILFLSISTLNYCQSKAETKETVDVVVNLLNKCVNHDWMLYDILFNGKPFVNYNVPFNENASNKVDESALGKRDQYFKGEFGLDPRSELSRKLIDPLDKEFIRMSSENPEPRDSMNAISKKEKDIGVYYVYIIFNMKNIEGNRFTSAKIPAALVTKADHPFRDSCDWHSYFIAFGNWKNAVQNSSGYTYKFIHLSGSHFVDNVVVVLTGVESRIEELLKEINWQRLNNTISN